MGGTGVVVLGTEMDCQSLFRLNSIELFNLRKVVVGLDLDSTASLGYSR